MLFGKKNKEQNAADKKDEAIKRYIENWDKLSPAQRDGLCRAVGVQPPASEFKSSKEAYEYMGYGN